MSLIEFDSEQKIIQNEIRKFTQAEVEPVANDMDRTATFPGEVIKKLGDLGFLGAIISEQYGGAGLDTTSLCIIVEELARASASVALVIAVHNCCVAYPLSQFGADELKEKYLTRLASGTIGGCVMPSNLDSINTFETKAVDSIIQVAGVSDFVMNGAQAGIFVIPLVVQDRYCVGVFDCPDNCLKEEHVMLGMRASGIVRVNISGFDFPIGNVMDRAANNQNILTLIEPYRDIGIAAISLGIAEACYDAALAYSKERKQFGRFICEFPMVREMLVDMRTNVDVARLLVYDAASRCDRGSAIGVAARCARVFADETAVSAGTTSVQIHGGYGYTKDYPVERFFRDAKSIQVIGCSSYQIKDKIAKEILS